MHKETLQSGDTAKSGYHDSDASLAGILPQGTQEKVMAVSIQWHDTPGTNCCSRPGVSGGGRWRWTFCQKKMNTIKSLAILFLLFISSRIATHARFVRDLDMKALMEGSQLVLVGEVKSIKPSGITTELFYPTWEGVVFEWLNVYVEVVEPVKGTKKGEIVRTFMLSTRGPGPVANAPGMVDPKVGQLYLLCLLPTNAKGVYASVTAPFDDNLAVFLLDRKLWVDGAAYYKDGKKVAFQEQNDKNRVLWNLVNGRGKINPDGVEYLRNKYKKEIATSPPKEAVIHLKWRKETSASGWQWNVPDEKEKPGR